MRNAVCLLLGLLPAVDATADCLRGDCRNGQGEMRYPDGSRYFREWQVVRLLSPSAPAPPADATVAPPRIVADLATDGPSARLPSGHRR